MLYIVGTQWYPHDSVKSLPNEENILYPDNIRVINHEVFSEFIGLKGKAKDNFDQIIELNKDSNIETLKQIHKLNDVQWNDTNQLHDTLEKRELIKISNNEYFKIKSKVKKEQKKLH
jgi:hypothetical protein